MSQRPLQADDFHPTIGSAYHAVEGYLDCLAASCSAVGSVPPVELPPIDALLTHFVALYQPVRPIVVDLAASPTWGVSTLLCRTVSSMRQVVSSLDDSPEKWQPVLDRYLCDWSLPLVKCVNVAGAHEALNKISDPQAPILIITTISDAMKQQRAAAFENWLELAPQALILVLGVGKTGDSSLLASLAVRCMDSPYRLALLRELAPALAESQLALVGRRDNVAFESILPRIGHLFGNQFQFIDLIKRACDSALEQSILNEPLSTLRAGVLEPDSLITAYDLRRAWVEREQELQDQLLAVRQELQDLRHSLTFRIFQAMSRFVRLPKTGRRVVSDDAKGLTNTPMRRAG